MQTYSTLRQGKQYFRRRLSDYWSLITDHWPWPLITSLLPLFLSGCMGVYEGGFECPPGEGAGCSSISEVNEMVNKGVVPKQKPMKDRTEGECGECPSSGEGDTPFGHQAEPQIWYSPEFVGGVF